MAVTAAEIERQIDRIHKLREMQTTYKRLHESACVMLDQFSAGLGLNRRSNYGGTLAVARELKQRIRELANDEQRILKSPVQGPEAES
jgi:hypothetical protein